MSFYTSLSGLSGAQTELSTISNNIANVGTTGFKRSRAEFGDIIATSPLQKSNRVIGSGVALKAINQQFTLGAIKASLNSLDIAISGQGFLAVKPKMASNEVVFTRNGAFTVDANRYVVDAAGQTLQVYPVNQEGTVTTSSLQATQSLRLPQFSGVPRATQDIDISLNLPADAEVIPNSPRYQPPAAPYAFNPQDETTYNHMTSTTVYDSLGNPMPATIYYVKTQNATSGTPENKWQAHIFINDTELQRMPGGDGTVPPIELTFDTQGKMTAPMTPFVFQPYTPDNGADPMVISLNHGASTTQYSDPFTVTSLLQDGYQSGRLDGVDIDTFGVVRASFTNGQTIALGKIVLANFANPNGLKQVGDTHYAVTGASGEPQLGEAGLGGFGNIMSGSLESSNVDITEELVNLITAQRNFQANAKAIETGSNMTQAIINIRS